MRSVSCVDALMKYPIEAEREVRTLLQRRRRCVEQRVRQADARDCTSR